MTNNPVPVLGMQTGDSSIMDNDLISDQAGFVFFGTDFCKQAAALAWKTTQQLSLGCKDCEHACPLCVIRDPLVRPSAGDRLKLPNGKTIEVYNVNMGHCVEAKITYKIVGWKKWSGGRAMYERNLKGWDKLVLGATVLRKGEKPRRFNEDYELRMAAFNLANSGLSLPGVN
jgi:hypothetical protein